MKMNTNDSLPTGYNPDTGLYATQLTGGAAGIAGEADFAGDSADVLKVAHKKGVDLKEVEAAFRVGDEAQAILAGNGIPPDAGTETPVCGVLAVYTACGASGGKSGLRKMAEDAEQEQRGAGLRIIQQGNDLINGKGERTHAKN